MDFTDFQCKQDPEFYKLMKQMQDEKHQISLNYIEKPTLNTMKGLIDRRKKQLFDEIEGTFGSKTGGKTVKIDPAIRVTEREHTQQRKLRVDDEEKLKAKGMTVGRTRN